MKVSIYYSNIAALSLFLGLSSLANSQDYGCGSLDNHYGPFDYRSSRPELLKVVEVPHFPHKVESLRGGNTSITPGGDIAYTLRVFPNHHRALMAMMKLAEREKTDKPRDSTYSMECWLERAERFRPDDQMAKALHGIYLARKGKNKLALEKLDAAVELGNASPNINYNIGLAYFEIGQFEKALQSAHRAYAEQFPLPGLRDKLKRAGKWHDLPSVKPELETEGKIKEPTEKPRLDSEGSQ